MMHANAAQSKPESQNASASECAVAAWCAVCGGGSAAAAAAASTAACGGGSKKPLALTSFDLGRGVVAVMPRYGAAAAAAAAAEADGVAGALGTWLPPPSKEASSSEVGFAVLKPKPVLIRDTSRCILSVLLCLMHLRCKITASKKLTKWIDQTIFSC
jgi:hypothetical protein